ncbi:hypothetical protein [Vibrio sonorensis]|uniref:hypothetical protein n=1 Tax=Vibrio sonorensis TaxID=1004316 RepID=UPI0008D9ED25|nr:hypothetical protein [Vibrio sonorensis]
MGRRSYGRTGQFAKQMKLNVWYSNEDICLFFLERGQEITPAQAKVIIDSMHRSKCYKTQKKRNPQKGMRVLLKARPHNETETKPPAPLSTTAIDIRQHFTRLLLSSDWGVMPEQKTIELEKTSPLIEEISQASQESRPIEYQGSLCALVACRNCAPSRVKIVLETVGEHLLGDMSKEIYSLHLS